MSAHTTLYRKWRPIDFDSVVGQDHITDVLKYQIANDRVSHAYLFCGSRGTGKTTCAKILAKAVNCLNKENGNPCGKCENCKLIEAGATTDIIEMDAASNNGVDYIRDIRDEVIYTPSALRKKVYIIDEVHMLSQGAFNALLKTLEEPPSHVLFILATTELQKLPATITSRCQRFDFKRISSDDIASRLEYIGLKEDIAVTHEAAKLIGRISSGGMRDAISLLELCSGSGSKIDVAKVNTVSGIMGRDKCAMVLTAIIKKDIQTIFETVSDVFEMSSDVSVFFSELIEFLRDMLVIKSIKDSASYLDMTNDELSVTKAVSDLYTSERILFCIKSLESSYSTLSKSPQNKRVNAELALITLTDDKLLTTPEALLSRISNIEEKLAYGMFTNAENTVSIPENKEKSDKPKDNAAVSSASVSEDEELTPLASWNEAVSTVERSDSSSAGHLKLCRAYKCPNGIVVKVKNSFTKMLLDNNSVKALIATGINLADETSYTANNISFAEDKSKDAENDDPLELF